MVLLKGVRFGTMYKLQGSTISDGCNNSIVPDIGVEEERTPTVFEEKVMLWHQTLGHIKEKGFLLLHSKGMVEGISNYSLDFDFCEQCIWEVESGKIPLWCNEGRQNFTASAQ
jgi:hypothetical protein